MYVCLAHRIDVSLSALFFKYIKFLKNYDFVVLKRSVLLPEIAGLSNNLVS